MSPLPSLLSPLLSSALCLSGERREAKTRRGRGGAEVPREAGEGAQGDGGSVSEGAAQGSLSPASSPLLPSPHCAQIKAEEERKESLRIQIEDKKKQKAEEDLRLK
jgi:hypothetical protein